MYTYWKFSATERSGVGYISLASEVPRLLGNLTLLHLTPFNPIMVLLRRNETPSASAVVFDGERDVQKFFIFFENVAMEFKPHEEKVLTIPVHLYGAAINSTTMCFRRMVSSTPNLETTPKLNRSFSSISRRTRIIRKSSAKL